MRFRFAFSPLVWLAFGSLSLVACAKEHSARELIERYGDAGRRPIFDDEDDLTTPPVMGPFDAGPHVIGNVGLDAGRFPFPFDARIPFPEAGFPFDASRPSPEAGVRDAGRDAGARDAGAADANLPAWVVADAATVAVTVASACDGTSDAGADAGSTDAGSSDAGGSDAGCRASGAHTPPCYKAPSNCPALSESAYCTGFSDSGDLLLYGMDRGTSCRIGHDPRYPTGAGSNAFAQIGADIYSIDGDVILKRSITDGSFDVAPIQAWTIFAMGDALVIQAVNGEIRRFANWDALKAGTPSELLATASAGAIAAFGGNRTTMAAAWPDGTVYLLANGDARQRSVRLQGYNRAETGAIRGLDLGEDGRMFVATDLGVTIYNSADGRALSRLRTAALYGLSCEAGLPAGSTPPTLTSSPRVGYYDDARSDYIITSSDCRGPFNGPRYLAPNGGPELVVIGNFFGEPSTIRDERSTPHILVLTSVQSTHWNVTITPAAKVDRIIINGSSSTVALQSPTTIPMDTFYDERSLGTHPGEWPSFEESSFRSALERQTGRAVTETYGCHFGSTYVVRDVAPMCRR